MIFRLCSVIYVPVIFTRTISAQVSDTIRSADRPFHQVHLITSQVIVLDFYCGAETIIRVSGKAIFSKGWIDIIRPNIAFLIIGCLMINFYTIFWITSIPLVDQHRSKSKRKTSWTGRDECPCDSKGYCDRIIHKCLRFSIPVSTGSWIDK